MQTMMINVEGGGQKEVPIQGQRAFPSIVIDGRKLERVDLRRCKCGRSVDVLQVRHPKRTTPNLPMTGWEVEWSSDQAGVGCPGCAEEDEIARMMQAQNLRSRKLTRGVRREEIEKARDHNRSLGGSVASMNADILDEVIGSNPGPWITREAMRGHSHASLIEPIIVNLDDDQGAADGRFPLGQVDVTVGIPFIVQAEVFGYLDRHSRSDHGQWGPLPETPSPEATFSPSLGSVGDNNRLALDSTSGVIRSRYATKDRMTNATLRVSVATWLEPGRNARTFVLIANNF